MATTGRLLDLMCLPTRLRMHTKPFLHSLKRYICPWANRHEKLVG